MEEFDLDLLSRPDHVSNEDSEMEVDSNHEEHPQVEPWLDSRYPEPPMPMKNTPYASLLIEPDSLESHPDTAEPVIAVCRRCCSDLKANKVPALSTANHNYLGPVPPVLQDLTVVEEAMVSLCRAKCWIVQLRDDDDTSLPITQRAVHGHIIIYPQKPTAIAKTLPPPISDVITPICVIFVGSKPPTPEWLKDKARPLIVRKEKVQKALNWLKTHNHLYADIPIDQKALDDLPSEDILPFHIQHVIPNAGIDSTTSDYVPGSSLPAHLPALDPKLTDILSPPPSTIPFGYNVDCCGRYCAKLCSYIIKIGTLSFVVCSE